MNLNTVFLTLLLLLIWQIQDSMAQEPFTHDKSQIISIDSLVIKRNWRTRERIIMEELEFKAGEKVSFETINRSMDKVWNTGNFATVRYTIDTLEDGRHLMTLIARDVFTIYPILSISGNRQDYKIGLGMVDENFLGRNIRLNLRAGFASTGNDWDFRVQIPRQLLYKNMTLEFGNRFGYRVYSRIVERQVQYITPFDLLEVYGSIGNPWHKDYQYTFSPNLGWKYFRHKINSSLLDPDELQIPHPSDYTYKGLLITLSESVGTINRKRHRLDGYSAGISTGFGIGLDRNSPYFQTLGLSAQYHRSFNRIFQLSSKFSTSYTTSNVPSLQFYRGASEIKGYRTGEISGKSIYSVTWAFT